MRRTMSMGFPPFTKAVKWLIAACSGVYLLLLLLHMASPDTEVWVQLHFALLPIAVVHGWVWQLLTYSFLHAGLFHLLFNMLALWMFGAQFEMDWGTPKFLEFFFFCVFGAALCTVGLAYTGALGMSPISLTVGASGGIYGLLLAFGMIYGEREVMLFPLPFLMKAKYMVAILIFISLVGAMGQGGGVAYVAHLGGLLFGYVYLKLVPRGGMRFLFSERYYGALNSFQKWKRRRAARKFQVYMREHDPKQYFDEHGNYKGPGAGKDRDEHGNWIH